MNLIGYIKRSIAHFLGEEYMFFASAIEKDTEIGALYESLFKKWIVTRHFDSRGGWIEIWGKPVQSSAPTAITEES